MGNPLHVLLVEDREDDALLIARTLMRGGFEMTYRRVETADAMRAALQEEHWDIVISDYSMPAFSGLKALRVLKELEIDLPFVLVSGTIGEDVAVDAMKSGSHDYVMKDNLARLVPAVQRELQEARVRRARRRAEEQLRKLSRAVEQSPVGVLITDAEGNIEYVNPRFEEMTGYTAEEVLGKPISLLRSTAASVHLSDKMWDAILTDHEWRGELENVRKSGESYWTSVSISPVQDQEGLITHYVAIQEDITNRKRVEEERIQLVERMQRQHAVLVQLTTHTAIAEGDLGESLRVIAESAVNTLDVDSVNIWKFSLDGREMHALEEYQRGKGRLRMKGAIEVVAYSRFLAALRAGRVIAAANVNIDTRTQELNADYWLNKRVKAALEAPIRVHGEVVGVVSHQHFDSKRAWYPDEITFASQIGDLVAQAFLNTDLRRRADELVTITRVSREITSVDNLKRVFTSIAKHAADLSQSDAGGVFTFREDGRLCLAATHGVQQEPVERFNARGVDVGEGVIGLAVEQRKPVQVSDVMEEAESDFGEIVKQEEIRAILAVPMLRDSEVIGGIVLWHREPRRFAPHEVDFIQALAQQCVNAVENARFFAEEERRAAELARALKQQQELARLKSEFIQNVSHELRTPMAIIRGYIELLESGDLGELQPQQVEPVEIVARRMRMLSKMVDDINAILEVESRTPLRKPVDFASLVREMLLDFRVAASEAGLQLSADIPEDLPTIIGDPTHLHRVLDNLLGNALKFTPEGGTVAVRLRQQGEALVLEVQDTGIGIPEDKLDRVLDRFYQVDGSMSRRYGGSGLGLALVKEIADAHGGSVSIESEPGAGSLFRVRLPLHDRASEARDERADGMWSSRSLG
ncbi:MAG: ATP-binding protein [Anaerolineales bacterium]